MNRQDLLDLIPAYALGALDDDAEIAAVEQLLHTDEEAQSLLAEYEAISEVFAFAVPERQVPASLRDKLKTQIAERPQQPTIPVQQAKIEKDTPANVMPFPTWLWAAAASVIIVIALGVLLTQGNSEQPTISDGERIYNELAEQPDITIFEVLQQAEINAQGEVVIAPDGSQAVLRVAELPDRADDQSYQLWLIGAEQIESAGVFNWTNGNEPYFVALTEPLSDILTIAISLEPGGGSPLENAPSGDVLFAVELAAQ
ncbi:MAG: anti-sigma factor [Chloroflexota bacterium]